MKFKVGEMVKLLDEVGVKRITRESIPGDVAEIINKTRKGKVTKAYGYQTAVLFDGAEHSWWCESLIERIVIMPDTRLYLTALTDLNLDGEL